MCARIFFSIPTRNEFLKKFGQEGLNFLGIMYKIS